jgi:hypothetical protein
MTIGFCTLAFASLSPAMHVALNNDTPVLLLNAADEALITFDVDYDSRLTVRDSENHMSVSYKIVIGNAYSEYNARRTFCAPQTQEVTRERRTLRER